MKGDLELGQNPINPLLVIILSGRTLPYHLLKKERKQRQIKTS